MQSTQLSLVSHKTYDVAGPLNARAIVLIHGSVVTRKMWLPQLHGLSDVYRVIAPDLPGHGALEDRPFTFEAAEALKVNIGTIKSRLARARLRMRDKLGNGLNHLNELQFDAANCG